EGNRAIVKAKRNTLASHKGLESENKTPNPRERRARHPPIEYIGRGGGTNFEELISWPSHFAAMVERIAAAIASSRAFERSRSRTSVSSSANRQYRSLPSDVSRMRLQFRQNGLLTDAINPTRPLPSAYSYSVAGARGSASGTGRNGEISRERVAMIASAVRTRPRSQIDCASSGMNSI